MFSSEWLLSLRECIVVFRTCGLGSSLDLPSPSCASSFLLSSLRAGALLALPCSVCRWWFWLVSWNGYRSSSPTLVFVNIRKKGVRGALQHFGGYGWAFGPNSSGIACLAEGPCCGSPCQPCSLPFCALEHCCCSIPDLGILVMELDTMKIVKKNWLVGEETMFNFMYSY